jgi:hypothetical protein
MSEYRIVKRSLGGRYSIVPVSYTNLIPCINSNTCDISGDNIQELEKNINNIISAFTKWVLIIDNNNDIIGYETREDQI